MTNFIKMLTNEYTKMKMTLNEFKKMIDATANDLKLFMNEFMNKPMNKQRKKIMNFRAVSTNDSKKHAGCGF